MHTDLPQRAVAAGHTSAALLDQLFVTVACRKCEAYLDDPAGQTLAAADYTDLASLIDVARRAAGERLSRPAGVCRACGFRAQVTVVDYHSWSSAAGRDLVVRCRRQPLTGVQHELLFWEPGRGYGRAGKLTAELTSGIERDALFRRIGATVERAGIRAALLQLESAAGERRGDPELLQYAPLLLDAGKAELVARIAASHVALHREDGAGYFWLARALVAGVDRGLLQRTQLAQAEAYLVRALELQPTLVEAEQALAGVVRARGDLSAARACLDRALALRPDSTALLAELGALELDHDPERALALYERAVERAPRDLALTFGQAHALVNLGRVTEADVLLDEPRTTDPHHPRLAELERLLQMHRRLSA